LRWVISFLKGIDRQCMIVELRLQYYWDIFWDSFMTYQTFLGFICDNQTFLGFICDISDVFRIHLWHIRRFLGFICDISDDFRIHLWHNRHFLGFICDISDVFWDSFVTYQTFLGFICDISDVFRIHLWHIRHFYCEYLFSKSANSILKYSLIVHFGGMILRISLFKLYVEEKCNKCSN